jgi:acyl-CoA thioester hydrolase
MIVTETKIRVYYEDTDKMGVVYYGTYARYYEIGRTEMIRSLGFTYRQIEESGIMLPARSLKINYLKSAYYDDLLTVRTIVDTIPKVKFPIKTEIYNEKGELINSGEVVLVFYSAVTNKPVAAPKFFIDEMTRIFQINELH